MESLWNKWTWRQAAPGNSADSGKTLSSHIAQGHLLRASGKHTDAYKEFELALTLISPKNQTEYIEILGQLMLSAFASGRLALCCEWAEAAIRNGAQGDTLRACHNMAGHGYGDRGDLKQAERHFRLAVALSEELKSDNDNQGLLAALLRKRGQAAEAIMECDDSIARRAELGKVSRTEYIVKAEALRDLGFFEAGLKVLQQIKTKPNSPVPPEERRYQAFSSLSMAMAAADAGYPNDALVYLRGAAEEFGKDEKLGLWVASVGACIHAQCSNLEDSIALRNVVVKNLFPFVGDRKTTLGAYGQLGRAAYYLEDWSQCRDMWQACLALKPDPIDLPRTYYYLGECDRVESSFSSAAEHYRQAQAVNTELHYAKLAAQRLREMVS